MNLWIIKNPMFGYPKRRGIIKNCFDNIYQLLAEKGKPSDYFIISGGLFSNTHPNIAAISDAQIIINKISSLMGVELITTKKDIFNYDGKKYSTMSLLKNKNINIVDKEHPVLLKNIILTSDYDGIQKNIVDAENSIFKYENGRRLF